MAVSRVKTWASEVLSASDLNAEFDNLINNALSLISPLTGNLACGGNLITGLSLGSVGSPSLSFTGDTNTGLYASAADTVNVATGGVLAAQFGASFIIAAAPEDSRTNSVDVAGIIRSTTSGTPAAGIGTGLQFDAESGDENPSVFGRLDFAASDVGAGTEDTYLEVLLRVAGAAVTSCYRFAATGAFNAIFTHANTAARTYTLQDSSDTLVGRATTDTLTNKTLSGAVVTGAAGATPTANVIYTDSIIKGWCYLTGATWTIAADVNVSSITDNAAGDFTINWATAFANGNYAVVGTAATTLEAQADTLVVRQDTATAKSTTAVRMNVTNAADGDKTDPVAVNIIAIGLQ